MLKLNGFFFPAFSIECVVWFSYTYYVCLFYGNWTKSKSRSIKYKWIFGGRAHAPFKFNAKIRNSGVKKEIKLESPEFTQWARVLCLFFFFVPSSADRGTTGSVIHSWLLAYPWCCQTHVALVTEALSVLITGVWMAVLHKWTSSRNKIDGLDDFT